MSSSSLYSSSSSLSSLSKTANTVQTLGIWTIIALVLAICGGIALYFTFLSKKNEGKFTGFLGWLYDTLRFKNLVIETLLKITYLILAIFITLFSFGLVAVNILSALGVLIFGNLAVRIVYEFSLMTIIICKNTSDINSKLNKKEEVKKEEVVVEKAEVKE